MPGMNMNKMYRPKRPAMNTMRQKDSSRMGMQDSQLNAYKQERDAAIMPSVAQKINSMEQAFKGRNNKVRRPMTAMVGPAKPKYRPNPGLQARKDWIKTRVEMLDKKKPGIKRQQAYPTYLPVGGPGGKAMNRKRKPAMSKMNLRRERAAYRMSRRGAADRMARRENIKGMMKLRKNQ